LLNEGARPMRWLVQLAFAGTRYLSRFPMDRQ
jgi:hypothetical protein